MNIQEILNTIAAKKNLEKDTANELMNMILEGSISESQAGAILMGLKMKGESITEIASFAEAMRDKSVNMSLEGVPVIDTCGTGGDGLHTFNISTVSALIAAGTGVKIAKHGNRSVSSKCGSADVIAELNIDINSSPETVKKCIKATGIGFLFAPLLHSAMKNIMPVRKSLGIRTVFNILGPLTNPSRAKKQIIGVYDEKLCDIYAQVLLEMGHEEAYIVHGHDGLDEVSISSPTLIVHLFNKKIEKYEVTPEQFGIKRSDLSSIKGGDAVVNAGIIKKILKGEKGPMRDISCLNAAFAIHLGKKSDDLSDCYRLACESIDSGKAEKVLDKWIAFKD